MKKTIFFLLTPTIFLCFSCNSTSKHEEVQYQIQNTLSKYWNDQFEKETQNTSETIVLDSIKILEIDSISGSELILMKLNHYDNIFARNKKILELKMEEFKLKDELEVFKGSPDLREMEAQDLKDASSQLKEILELQKSLNEELESKSDSTDFLYFRAKFKLYATENGTTERSLETMNLLTKSFKIKEFEDLVKDIK